MKNHLYMPAMDSEYQCATYMDVLYILYTTIHVLLYISHYIHSMSSRTTLYIHHMSSCTTLYMCDSVHTYVHASFCITVFTYMCSLLLSADLRNVFVKNGPVADLIRNCSVGWKKIVMENCKHILRGILKGLHTLHQIGIIHRDVKGAYVNTL